MGRARTLREQALCTAPGHRLTIEEIGADPAARPGRVFTTGELWTRFCDALGVEPSITRGRLLTFVRWRWLAGDSRTMIHELIAGFSVRVDEVHGWDTIKLARAELAAEVDAAAEAGLPPRGQGHALPLPVSQYERLIAACPDDLVGARDRALLALGFGIAARRSELSGLRARDVQVTSSGLRVTTTYGKASGRTVHLPRGHPEADPVRAWLSWQAAAHLHPDGPALLQVDQHGTLGGRMSGRAISALITTCGDRAGIPGLNARDLSSGLAISHRARPTTDNDDGDSELAPYLHLVRMATQPDPENISG